MKNADLNRFDSWLGESSSVAALTLRQRLVPVEGKDAVIFPATYAKPESWPHDQEWLGYNIDPLSDGSNVCQIDSVGSQANRIESIFKRQRYRSLVPHVIIDANGNKIDLLDAGHRAADAIVRFSSLWNELKQAFESYRKGDAEPLAKLAPTSILFGAWDSRDTQVKLPRIIRSVIRAYNVAPLHRSAQYIPALEYSDNGLIEIPEDKQKKDALLKSMSEWGLNHAPAPWTHGGIVVHGEIRRDASINLAALRAIGVAADGDDAALLLRRYILGLALVAFTAPQETSLREGCILVGDVDKPAVWNIVQHDGRTEPFNLTHDEAIAFAKAAADKFGVGQDRTATFDTKTAREALSQSKEDRKKNKRLKTGSVKKDAVAEGVSS